MEEYNMIGNPITCPAESEIFLYFVFDKSE